MNVEATRRGIELTGERADLDVLKTALAQRRGSQKLDDLTARTRLV